MRSWPRPAQRADRLSLVGQLASGLAHEIGTPLNVIAGNAELLRMQFCPPAKPSYVPHSTS
jgi:signal transduction histidine kinase